MNDLVGAVDLRLDGCVESQWYRLGKLYDSLGFMFIAAAVALKLRGARHILPRHCSS